MITSTASSRSALVITKGIIVLIPIFLFGLIINNRYVLTSAVTFSFLPGHDQRVVKLVRPDSLINSAGTPKWVMTGDELAMTSSLGRLPESVTVRFNLTGLTQPYLLLQAQGSAARGTLSSIVRATALDNLGWDRTSAGPLTLWQRPSPQTKEKPAVRHYASLPDLRQSLPDLKRVAVVGVDPLALYQDPNYRAGSTVLQTNHIFRGTHRLIMYAGHETLNLAFDKIDLNRKKGADTVTVKISRPADVLGATNKRIIVRTIQDDGVTEATGIDGSVQAFSVSVPVTEAGVFFVEINTNEDVVFKNLRSTQKFMAFDGNIFLADGPAYGPGRVFSPVNLVTNGSLIGLNAVHPAGFQTVVFGKQKMTLKTIKAEQTFKNLQGLTALNFTQGDVAVRSDGQIAISPFQVLLARGAAALDVSRTPNFDPYDYVIAAYQPDHGDANLTAAATYQLKDLAVDKKKQIHFSLEAPGRTVAGSIVGLKRISVTYQRGRFPWNKIMQKINPFN